MRVRVEAAALAAQTAWAGRVLPARPSVPVLAGLLLQAGPDGLEVAAYDYETAARAAVEAQVAQEGRVLLPGAVLAAATAALPEGRRSWRSTPPRPCCPAAAPPTGSRCWPWRTTRMCPGRGRPRGGPRACAAGSSAPRWPPTRPARCRC
ncbi:hypothetical protein ACFQXA_38630 [Nocardiopsis composta]